MSRIAFITTIGSPWGGCEELWSQAAAQLTGKGFIVGAHVREWPEPVPQIMELERMGCQIKRGRLIGRVGQMLGARWEKWLDTFRPDLAVISQAVYVDGVDWMQACKERSIPYALLVHCAGDEWWPDDEKMPVLADGFESAAACFFVSQGNLEVVRRHLCIALPGAKVVRNPFNVAYEAAPPWPAKNGTYRMALVARLEAKAKGQDILFDVLSQEKWRKRPVEVSLFGSGPNHNGLTKLKEMHQLESVSFKGFTSDIEGIWRDHHALVLPSRYEGLPLAVVEAMLCGRPCIVTDVAGNAELLEDNVSGFVAKAPTPAAFDEALERAWERRSEWNVIGQAAARRVRELVPADAVAAFNDELLKLLKKTAALPSEHDRFHHHLHAQSRRPLARHSCFFLRAGCSCDDHTRTHYRGQCFQR